jgi:hypothetical protein
MRNESSPVSNYALIIKDARDWNNLSVVEERYKLRKIESHKLGVKDVY